MFSLVRMFYYFLFRQNFFGHPITCPWWFPALQTPLGVAAFADSRCYHCPCPAEAPREEHCLDKYRQSIRRSISMQRIDVELRHAVCRYAKVFRDLPRPDHPSPSRTPMLLCLRGPANCPEADDESGRPVTLGEREAVKTSTMLQILDSYTVTLSRCGFVGWEAMISLFSGS